MWTIFQQIDDDSGHQAHLEPPPDDPGEPQERDVNRIPPFHVRIPEFPESPGEQRQCEGTQPRFPMYDAREHLDEWSGGKSHRVESDMEFGKVVEFGKIENVRRFVIGQV